MTLQQEPGDVLTAWTPRTDLQLLRDQLGAMQAWHAARRADSAPARSVVTREMRLDLTRRHEARRREQAAMVERARMQMDEGGELLGAPRAPRAVLVHRREWVRSKVTEELRRRGIAVVAELDNGADAVGLAVVEQPDLMLVEDALPMVGGTEVIRSVREFCPGTVISAHAEGDAAIAMLLAAGARAVFTRRTPPADIGRELAALVSVG